MSIRFLADADLDAAIVRGVSRREPSIDFKSASDAELEGLSDTEVLELAAAEGRIRCYAYGFREGTAGLKGLMLAGVRSRDSSRSVEMSLDAADRKCIPAPAAHGLR